MSRSEIALIALLVALAAGLAGLVYGMQLGAATEVARQDKQAVKALSALIDSHKTLIGEAATASKNMRAALSLRATQDAQTNKDFKNALRKLESKKQITLLYNYVSATKEKGDRITYIESETSVAKRLNQQLAIKVFLLMCGFFTIMFFLFVLFVAVSFDFLPQEGEEYKTVLAIAKDILKYIFTVK